VLERIEQVEGRRFETVHVVGGGSRNHLLCQFTADAIGRPVLAGPAEATALGNLLVQLIAQGELGSLAEARQVARASTELRVFEPHHEASWDEAYARLGRLVQAPDSH
jgi:rhamnulokinase